MSRSRVQHVVVSEDVPVNTVLHVVQAYDPDGDDVTFSFTGTQYTQGHLDCKKLSGGVLAWSSVWGEELICIVGPADAAATHCLLLQ